jgi:hypothetical protein
MKFFYFISNCLWLISCKVGIHVRTLFSAMQRTVHSKWYSIYFHCTRSCAIQLQPEREGMDWLEYQLGSKIDLWLCSLAVPLLLQNWISSNQNLCFVCLFTTHILPRNILCCSYEKMSSFRYNILYFISLQTLLVWMSAQQIQYYQKIK